MPLSWKHAVAALACAVVAPAAVAQATVTGAWIRGTVPQQKATGLFAQITSTVDARLVSASTPAAAIVEIHEMRMDGDTMRMRALESLALPAGRMVELKPGGFHVMLIDLKQPLKVGDTVPVTLVVERAADKSRQAIALQVPVRSLRGTDTSGGHGAHGHKH
jgi:periplasmic copper chaperone A